MAKIKVTKVKSAINRTQNQKRTLEALGLKKMGQVVEHENTPNILGMINKVSHFVPKFGFTNINRKEFTGVNLDTLQEYVDAGRIKDEVTIDVLVENRLAGKNDLVKILGRGELKAKLKITVHKFTASAQKAIEAAGGEAVTL